MLSEKEREFLRDWIAEKGGCSDEFRKKWNYDYERVLKHRVREKYAQILFDLFFLELALSSYEKDDLFYSLLQKMIDKEGINENDQKRVIQFHENIAEYIKEVRKNG